LIYAGDLLVFTDAMLHEETLCLHISKAFLCVLFRMWKNKPQEGKYADV
jgi:hypothetical protein